MYIFINRLQWFYFFEDPSPEDTAGDVIVLKGKVNPFWFTYEISMSQVIYYWILYVNSTGIKSFKELVLDNNKDVLVEFYAPWYKLGLILTRNCHNLTRIFTAGINSV
jgi:hypothetical protein